MWYTCWIYYIFIQVVWHQEPYAYMIWWYLLRSTLPDMKLFQKLHMSIARPCGCRLLLARVFLLRCCRHGLAQTSRGLVHIGYYNAKGEFRMRFWTWKWCYTNNDAKYFSMFSNLALLPWGVHPSSWVDSYHSIIQFYSTSPGTHGFLHACFSNKI